ncbi:MAG TPA: LemA family protein [Baekduia sp.]|nr:LemA family protein [Baekduia sp.]
MAVVYAGLMALGAVAAWLATTRRALRQARDRSDRAWTDIDALLRRRHDLTAQLLATVAREVPAEEHVVGGACEALDRAMAASSPLERTEAERRLVTALAGVAALAERHPILGGCGEFVEQQAQLADVEDALLAARRIYNADVRLYRHRLQRAPTVVLRAEPFPEPAYFELDHTRELGVASPWARATLGPGTA